MFELWNLHPRTGETSVGQKVESAASVFRFYLKTISGLNKIESE
jgi:hypothetical protein